MIRRTSTALLALAALAAAACGSSSGNTGTMSVRLVDAPGDYTKIELDVRKVEIHSDADGWVTLGTPNKVVDLLSLTNGVEETLVDGKSLPAGSYGQLRLVLGPNNQVTLKDDPTPHTLTVPSGMQSGVKLNVHFDVAAGTTKDVFIDFDAHRSIFVHGAGSSGKYLLRPVVRAVDRVVTGSISGKLTDAAPPGAGLPGAIVMAETLDAAGVPTVVRSVKTAADGSYTLDLLPVGATYHVVAQPVVVGTVTTSYAPQASDPIPVSAASPTASWSAAFTAALAGTGTGSVTPAATVDQADTVVATAIFPPALTPRTLVVRTVDAKVALDGTESWTMDALPIGAYAVSLSRRTVDVSGNETIVTTPEQALPVTAGATATVNFTVP